MIAAKESPVDLHALGYFFTRTRIAGAGDTFHYQPVGSKRFDRRLLGASGVCQWEVYLVGKNLDFFKCESLGNDQELTEVEREQLEELLRATEADSTER